LPGNQGCSATKIGVGTPFPPHYTNDLGWGRTLTIKYCSGALT